MNYQSSWKSNLAILETNDRFFYMYKRSNSTYIKFVNEQVSHLNDHTFFRRE